MGEWVRVGESVCMYVCEKVSACTYIQSPVGGR